MSWNEIALYHLMQCGKKNSFTSLYIHDGISKQLGLVGLMVEVLWICVQPEML
jgi:hypothetical protein